MSEKVIRDRTREAIEKIGECGKATIPHNPDHSMLDVGMCYTRTVLPRLESYFGKRMILQYDTHPKFPGKTVLSIVPM